MQVLAVTAAAALFLVAIILYRGLGIPVDGRRSQTRYFVTFVSFALVLVPVAYILDRVFAP